MRHTRVSIQPTTGGLLETGKVLGLMVAGQGLEMPISGET
jgi:hypothetical protein